MIWDFRFWILDLEGMSLVTSVAKTKDGAAGAAPLLGQSSRSASDKMETRNAQLPMFNAQPGHCLVERWPLDVAR